MINGSAKTSGAKLALYDQVPITEFLFSCAKFMIVSVWRVSYMSVSAFSGGHCSISKFENVTIK